MPRTEKGSVGNVCYHVLNQGNAYHTVFFKDGDPAGFLQARGNAHEVVAMRVLANCLIRKKAASPVPCPFPCSIPPSNKYSNVRSVSKQAGLDV
jgi:hypothetical protein